MKDQEDVFLQVFAAKPPAFTDSSADCEKLYEEVSRCQRGHFLKPTRAACRNAARRKNINEKQFKEWV